MKRIARDLVLALAVAWISIWLAVRVTPAQSVSAAGQTMRVGAAEPGIRLSGPGELQLFGQTIPTLQQFSGPIRPRLQLTHITVNAELDRLVAPNSPSNPTLEITKKLGAGWIRYCAWEIFIAVIFDAVIMLAVTSIAGWTGDARRRAVIVTLATVVVANAIAVFLMAEGTPHTLGQVHSLDDLVGRAPSEAVPAAIGPNLPGVQAIVMGDSTAAGAGNPPVDNASALDAACKRSRDSYAQFIASAEHWNVMNLSCSEASISDGILGVQTVHDQIAPPQLAIAKRASGANVFIISIGANDMNWNTLVKLCVGGGVCGDQATTAYFQQLLADFSRNYYDLLSQLSSLPRHPRVLVNEYYAPFDNNIDCLKSAGLTSDRAQFLLTRLREFNDVLHNGATTFGFDPVNQDFTGHGVCAPDSFVQGMHDPDPFHPTPAGELAIALADQQALSTQPAGANSSS